MTTMAQHPEMGGSKDPAGNTQQEGEQTNTKVMVLVVLVLAGVIFVGIALGTSTDGTDETTLYGFVGLALGAVIGLLSPSIHRGN